MPLLDLGNVPLAHQHLYDAKCCAKVVQSQ
nr:MAG TPA: hypothetical protein [Caudoviricetes sp.]